jgi:hypothetical protein
VRLGVITAAYDEDSLLRRAVESVLNHTPSTSKRLIKTALRTAGIEIRRARPQAEPPLPPPLVGSVIEALYRVGAGQRAAFLCPLDHCRCIMGFGYGPSRWHPMSAAVEEYRRGEARTYENSVLRKFYDAWQPSHAAEVVVGFHDVPKRLRSYRPYAFFPPWDPSTPEERMARVEWWYRRDAREHGHAELDLNADGHQAYGPVSEPKGRFEFDRCVALHASMTESGYDRRRGDVKVDVLKRGAEMIFIIAGGRHRRAVMTALGHRTVPTIPQSPMIIDTSHVDHWPQVRQGLWRREDALRYVDHLFDFDSIGWARERGL